LSAAAHGQQVQRFKGRLEKAEGIVAASTARRLKNLQHKAKALNMTLVPA
jgi:hypothetical protein